ncbi:MAG: S1C family serine protease [Burkholderiaceae bacterium]
MTVKTLVQSVAVAVLSVMSFGAAQALEPDALFRKLSPSVWVVKTFDAQQRPLGSGSAVVIGPGRLITNCHVLAKAASFAIKQDNVAYGASLEYPDVKRDLCQIKVSNFNAPAVQIAPADALSVGSRVYAIGSPAGLENTISDGILSGLRGGTDASGRLLQTTAPISPGSSGGGLFDSEGRLLGITTFILRDTHSLNFAVPAEWIAEVPARGQAELDQRSQGRFAAEPQRPASGTPGLLEPLRPGDTLEYVLVDGFTGVRTPVLYRLDRIEGDQLFFNQGSRVEKADGQVVSIGVAAGGFFDSSAPPGGWGRQDAGARARLDYRAPAGDRVRHQLNVGSYGESTLAIAGTQLKVTRVVYSGFFYPPSGALTQGMPPERFKATAWYSAELQRVVQFDVDARIGTRPHKESLQLVRVLRH